MLAGQVGERKQRGTIQQGESTAVASFAGHFASFKLSCVSTGSSVVSPFQPEMGRSVLVTRLQLILFMQMSQGHAGCWVAPWNLVSCLVLGGQPILGAPSSRVDSA